MIPVTVCLGRSVTSNVPISGWYPYRGGLPRFRQTTRARAWVAMRGPRRSVDLRVGPRCLRRYGPTSCPITPSHGTRRVATKPLRDGGLGGPSATGWTALRELHDLRRDVGDPAPRDRSSHQRDPYPVALIRTFSVRLVSPYGCLTEGLSAPAHERGVQEQKYWGCVPVVFRCAVC
jgi:hypothetical protein